MGAAWPRTTKTRKSSVYGWELISNYRAARRTTFINTVTAERVKWIENLRTNISEFCGLTYTWCASNIEGTEEKNEILKKIDVLRHHIRLQLNPDPSATLDREIEKLIAEVPYLTHQTQQDELKIAINNLIETSQTLLKEEWEKVKLESKRGDLKENENCLDFIFAGLNQWCMKRTKKWRKSA